MVTNVKRTFHTNFNCFFGQKTSSYRGQNAHFLNECNSQKEKRNFWSAYVSHDNSGVVFYTFLRAFDEVDHSDAERCAGCARKPATIAEVENISQPSMQALLLSIWSPLYPTTYPSMYPSTRISLALNNCAQVILQILSTYNVGCWHWRQHWCELELAFSVQHQRWKKSISNKYTSSA